MADDTLQFDNNGDVPRPDGYSSTYSSTWLEPSVFAAPNGVQGYSGVSPLAARSDHVHPCNIDPRPPCKIGIAGYLEEELILNSEFVTRTKLDSFGKIGIPASDNMLSNMYSLSNHVHAYGFIGYVTHLSATNRNKLYQSVPDGRVAMFGLKVKPSVGDDGGSVDAILDDDIITDNDSLSVGYTGRIPFPARFDHCHPLNCKDLHDANATGNSVKDNIKPIDFDPTKTTSGYGASYGTDNFYARTDHVHPLPTDGTGADGIGGDTTWHSNRFSNVVTVGGTNSNGIYVENGTIGYANYGSDGFNKTWKRDSSENTNGFKINVVSCVGQLGNATTPVLFFRTLTFDKYGLCREVSEAKGVKLN